MKNILTRRLLALGAAGTVLLGVGGVALAQTDNPAPQNAPAAKSPRQGGRMNRLNLTAEQQAKLKALREEFQTRYMEILTPEQRQQLEAARQNRGARRGGMRMGQGRMGHGFGIGRGMRMGRGMGQGRGHFGAGMAAKLNLTEEQKAKLQAARSNFTAELKSAREKNLQGADRLNAFRTAREKFRTEVTSILTPEQQEQLKSQMQNRAPRANPA